MMSNSPNSASKRQPVSCEPCRTRKIKCTRGSPPCNTCVRRGIPARCAYKDQGEIASSANTFAYGGDQSLLSDHSQLLERFRNLEDLVHNRLRCTNQSSDPPLTTFDLPSLSQSEQTSPSSSSHPADRSDKGHLVLSPSGHVRYEPPNSAHWKSVLADKAVDTSFDALEDTTSVDQGFTSNFPFDTASQSSVDDLLRDLPPIPYCDELKTQFFNVFSSLFHILHDPTFEAEYTAFKEHPHGRPLSWLSLLYVILSIAVTALPDDSRIIKDLGRNGSSQANIQMLSLRYRNAALRCLSADQVLFRHNIQTLQALVLLIYSMNHSQGHSWPLLGMTYSIALALGCHVDPERFGLNRLQVEERRRVWAGLMMLYTIQNMSLGNIDPSRITNEVKLPADVDDIDLSMDQVRPHKQGPTQMSYVLFKFKLYNISAEISKQNSAHSLPTRFSIGVLEEKISSQRRLWNARYLSDTRHTPLETHHTVHLNILYSYSHQLLLLLHRPCFLPRLEHYSHEAQRESHRKCLESAKAILGIHKSLAESSDFAPYRWYNNGLGSFHAFHAAVVLATVLVASTNEDNELLPLFAETMAKFNSLADQSLICRRATPILRALWNVIQRAQVSPAVPGHISMPDTGQDLHHPDHSITNFGTASGSIDLQMDTLISQLRPEQWLGPGSICWNEWGQLVDGVLEG